MNENTINNKLEKLYTEYVNVFKGIEQFSNDFTYPTFIKCTKEYAESKIKILFVDKESTLWYRDKNKEMPDIKDLRIKRYPWIYKESDYSAKSFMDMYEEINVEKPAKSPYWEFVSQVNQIAQRNNNASLYTYFLKSDVNIQNFNRIKVNNHSTIRQKQLEFEKNNLMLLREELKILTPNYIFFFSQSESGKYPFLIEGAINQRVNLLPVEEAPQMSYVVQTQFTDTRMFFLPSPNMMHKGKSIILKVIENLITKEYTK